jgi:hypothetical protein
VKVGDLVKITRVFFGIPNGTIGLILKVYPGGSDVDDMVDIQICNAQQRTIRRLERDLEVISESR